MVSAATVVSLGSKRPVTSVVVLTVTVKLPSKRGLLAGSTDPTPSLSVTLQYESAQSVPLQERLT